MLHLFKMEYAKLHDIYSNNKRDFERLLTSSSAQLGLLQQQELTISGFESEFSLKRIGALKFGETTLEVLDPEKLEQSINAAGNLSGDSIEPAIIQLYKAQSETSPRQVAAIATNKKGVGIGRSKTILNKPKPMKKEVKTGVEGNNKVKDKKILKIRNHKGNITLQGVPLAS